MLGEGDDGDGAALGEALGLGVGEALGVGEDAVCVRSLDLLQINFLPFFTHLN